MSEGSSGQFDKPSLPVFSTEDPLLPTIKARLEQNPQKKEQIKKYFARDLVSNQKEIVGVRSEDLMTFLDYVTQDSIPLYSQNESIMGKSEGWFYTTANYNNEYFDTHPELKPTSYTQVNFMEMVDHNIGTYPENAAFGAAFLRNVMPVLKPGWQQTARRMILERNNMDPETPYEDFQQSSIIQELITQLKKSSLRISKGKMLTEADAQKIKRPLTDNEILTTLIHDGVDKRKVFEFMAKVSETRSGIMVGFNKNILQGEVVTDQVANAELLHGSHELIIKPPNGKVDIKNSVVAIESLGTYEDDQLAKLGLS